MSFKELNKCKKQTKTKQSKKNLTVTPDIHIYRFCLYLGD